MAVEKYLSSRKVLGLSEDSSFPPPLLALIEKIVGADKMNRIMADIGEPYPDANGLIDLLFERLNIKWRCENPEILENLDSGPKVFVANHPYGLPDAFALFKLLTTYRSDIKIFANKLLAATRLDEPRLLHVDPFGAEASRGLNRRSIAIALKHLRNGGDLALFPGRVCSHLKTSDWTISDSDWTDQVRRFVEVSDGEMVPLFISGRNSMLFNISGLIHPRIRTYMLLREFLRGNHDFSFRVGEPVSAKSLSEVSKSVPAGTFSRSLVYALKTGSRKVPDIPALISPEHRTDLEELRLRRPAVSIEGDRAHQLISSQKVLFRQNHHTVFEMQGNVSEDIMDLICEVRFRAYAQQSNLTDASQMRDHFDEFYNHFLLWNDREQKLIGVYRYLLPDPSQRKISGKSLVTNSIFNFGPEFKAILPRSMELGRAAILPEYQKSYSPLMLLWRAILEIPCRNKAIKYLFGPVTMGQNFNPVSRELLRRYIMQNFLDETMQGHITPKSELDFEIPREVDLYKLEKACKSFSVLGNIINGIEGGNRQLPVLFRHYANVGCKYLSFGEWKELDYAMAGVTILDLQNCPQNVIAKYLGKDHAQEFLTDR